MKFTAGTRYQLLHVWFLLGAGQGTAKSLMPGLLSDPELQPLFEEVVPNALDPAYKFDTLSGNVGVTIGDSLHEAGLVDRQGTKLKTPIWGYGKDISTISWPGLTFEVRKDQPLTITWSNTVRNPFLLTGVGRFDNQSVIDSTLHWAYGLHSCNIDNITHYCGGLSSLEKYGVPMVPHLHGGHTEFGSDGNPEFFFSRGGTLRGPRFVRSTYVYENKQPAGSLWYHDHALGITRLNVYSGLAGFYLIRDDFDTGRMDNPLNLPAYPYEAALAIQDRMFKSNGELFFPAFEGDPGYADFIDKDIQAKLPNDHGPSVLTEFFGDHMVVNGKIWPRMAVEPRMYRLRLLNACDSRFLLLQFVVGDMGMLEIPSSPERVPFTVIGSDQGLAERVDWTVIGNGTSDFLVFEPGSRFDILIDFSGLANRRVIMRNVAADSPFSGEIEGDHFDNRRTDRIMALDVVNLLQPPVIMAAGIPVLLNPLLPASTLVSAPDPVALEFQAYAANLGSAISDEPRRVALFEGQDKYGRLQPLMGTVTASKVQWPTDQVYVDAHLQGGIEGSVSWKGRTPENPVCNTIETWEIWNPTADAHPIHLHLVYFQTLERFNIIWDSNTDDEGKLNENRAPQGDGTYLAAQDLVEHGSEAGDPSTLGHGWRLVNATRDTVPVQELVGHHFTGGRRDMVVALPGQVTTIRMKFDKPGRFVWHCHILSHEDHNMMHVIEVQQGTCV